MLRYSTAYVYVNWKTQIKRAKNCMQLRPILKHLPH